MIKIIDYGMGNLRSVEKGFQRLKISTQITSEIEEIKKADKLILPGVGFFSHGMKILEKTRLIDILNTKVLKEKTPILGICLGMQLFTKHSEEGNVKGLGWIDGETKKFNTNSFPNKLKIPHMGWNTISNNKLNPLLKDIPEHSPFYFVHSYHIACHNKNNIIATTNYGFHFVSAIHYNNIYGTQFHPEKSHMQGLKILKNFAEL